MPCSSWACAEHKSARGCSLSGACLAARQVSSSVSSSRRASSDLELDGSHLRPIRVTLSPVGAAVDRHANWIVTLSQQLGLVHLDRAGNQQWSVHVWPRTDNERISDLMAYLHSN